MSEEEAEVRVRKLILLSGRSLELAARMADQMTRRERSRGLELAAKWESLAAEVSEWLVECGERMLQDQASAET
jgi:hypothetical protein